MIGIIGATGDIGLECSKFLNNFGIRPLKLGYRDKSKIVNKSDNLFQFIDLDNKKSCMKFIKGCDCVINCARTLDICNLIEAIEVYKAKLIDINYYKFNSKKDISRGSIYHGIGASPGLTEVLPRIIASKFDNIKNMTIYYASRGNFTFNAAREYLYYLRSKQIYPSTKFKNGNIVPLKDNGLQIILTFDQEKWNKFSYMDERTLKVCKQLKIENAMFYTCMKDGYVYEFLKRIHGKNEENIEILAEKLVKLSKIDSFNKSKFSGFIVEASGTKENYKTNIKLILKSMSPARLTALVVVATSLLMLENKVDYGTQDMSTIPIDKFLLKKMSEIDPSFFYKFYNSDTLVFNELLTGEI